MTQSRRQSTHHEKPIVLYHGTGRWHGLGNLRATAGKKMVNGPGIYLTTSPETARKYGRTIVRFEIDPDIQTIRGVRVPLEDAIAFVEDTPRLRHRRDIAADLVRNARRLDPSDDEVLASALVNLLVNYDALRGQVGPALAKFLVDHGIDGEIVRQSDEDWLVLYNLDKVIRAEKVRDDDLIDMPLIRDVLENPGWYS